MPLSRRSFLKILGGTAAAAVAAPILPASAGPLFVPAERLDFGVPRQIVTAQSVTVGEITALWEQQARTFDQAQASARMARTVPMTLLQNEYLHEWGGSLAAGSTILVDQVTAERWATNGVAVAGAAAPREIQERSAKVQAERRAMREERAADASSWWAAEKDDGSSNLINAGRGARVVPTDEIEALFRRQIAKAKRTGAELRFDDAEFAVPEGYA
jgi:hypothetical protein